MKDITGERYGKYVVLGEGTRGQHYWLCRCDCGTEKEVYHYNLTSGKIVSCGCHKKAMATTHGMSHTRAYKVWENIVQRGDNPNSRDAKNYSERGITICKSWRESFEQFYADMGDPPEGMSIERKDNDKGYEPGNCIWATPKEQANNQRPRSRYKLTRQEAEDIQRRAAQGERVVDIHMDYLHMNYRHLCKVARGEVWK